MKEEKKLEELLSEYNEVEIPSGLNERISARIHSIEEVSENSNKFLFFFYDRKIAAAFGVFFIAAVMLFLSNNNQETKQDNIADAKIEQLEEDIEYYNTVNSIITEVELEEEIDDLEEYLDILNS